MLFSRFVTLLLLATFSLCLVFVSNVDAIFVEDILYWRQNLDLLQNINNASDTTNSTLICNPLLLAGVSNASIELSRSVNLCPDLVSVPIISSIVVAVQIIFALSITLLLCIRRKHDPVKSRSAFLTSYCILWQSVIICIVIIRFAIGRAIFPCAIYTFAFCCACTAILVPYFLPLYRLFIVMRINQCKLEFSKIVQDDVQALGDQKLTRKATATALQETGSQIAITPSTPIANDQESSFVSQQQYELQDVVTTTIVDDARRLSEDTTGYPGFVSDPSNGGTAGNSTTPTDSPTVSNMEEFSLIRRQDTNNSTLSSPQTMESNTDSPKPSSLMMLKSIVKKNQDEVRSPSLDNPRPSMEPRSPQTPNEGDATQDNSSEAATGEEVDMPHAKGNFLNLFMKNDSDMYFSGEKRRKLQVQMKVLNVLIHPLILLLVPFVSLFLHFLLFSFMEIIQIAAKSSVFLINPGSLFNFSLGCGISTNFVIVVALDIVLHCIIIFVLFLINIRARDTFFIKYEVVVMLIIYAAIMVLFVIFAFIKPISSFTDYIVPYGLVLLVGPFFQTILTGFIPIALSFRRTLGEKLRRDKDNIKLVKKARDELDGLKLILADVRMRKEFLSFGKRSFCPEFILCWQEIHKYRLNKSRKERIAIFDHIVATFLKNQSVMELNLPVEERNKHTQYFVDAVAAEQRYLKKHIKGKKIDEANWKQYIEQSKSEMFDNRALDDLKKHVEHNMLDLYLRFKTTTACKQFLKKHKFETVQVAQ